MEQSLHYLAMAGHMLIQKNLSNRLKDTGLTIGHPKILDYLKDHDGSPQIDIARACFLEAGSLTTILNGMEEKGLIERRSLPGNRRSFHIFLTKEGKKKIALIEQAFSEIEADALKNISEEELDTFLSIYQKINQNLQSERTK